MIMIKKMRVSEKEKKKIWWNKKIVVPLHPQNGALTMG